MKLAVSIAFVSVVSAQLVQTDPDTAEFLGQLSAQGWLTQNSCGALRRSNQADSTPGYNNKCDEDGKLVALTFFKANRTREDDYLTGTLPPFSLVPNLEHLALFGNGITGTIPELRANQKLKFLDLADNALEGTIPSLFGLLNLEHVSVYGNKLTGTAPPLTDLPSLRQVSFAYNGLTGTIPVVNGTSPKLEYFSMFSNKITGTIPGIKGIPSLRKLKLYDNELTGTIPSLAESPLLTIVSLGDNMLTGTIPSLSGITRIEKLLLRNNKFSGTLPALDNLQFLTVIDVSQNLLTDTGTSDYTSSCSPLMFAPVCTGNSTSVIQPLTGVPCNCQGQATQVRCEMQSNPWEAVGVLFESSSNSTCEGAIIE